ncbi:UDP-N-acetylglucosamine--undecaprenyl-phosphate N-acetylglucosaminephosphotransferase [Vibrio sp. FNV 38]|nr:UDP-N-acetylglucosamine--undecaprenyl-phosphate N-acetylglucosaminephosphotransferase [Vibrio sp. FNV 38]
MHLIFSQFTELLQVFLLAFVSLFCFRKVAQRVGLVDSPNGRKKHKGYIPLVGGLAICTTLTSFLIKYPEVMPSSQTFLFCIIALTTIGVMDDKWDISYKFRLIIQVALALVMIFGAGLQMKTIGNILLFGSINLGWLSTLVTIIAVIAAINAFNMVDGIDGLLGGLSIVTFGSLAIIMAMADAPKLSFLCVVILVAILPYIAMNLGLLGRRRRVFMGDAGSMLIGFTVIWVLLISTQEADSRVIRPVTALWLIAVPLMDMMAIMFRRIRRGDSPFKPDREHLHHIFQRLGLSPRQTLSAICFISLGYASFGILGELARIPEAIMFVLFIFAFAIYAIFLSYVWVITTSIRRWRHKDKD